MQSLPQSAPPSVAAWRSDAFAGTTTAVVLIPQAMAYALVAGLPPVHGLYAAMLPLVGYALVGRSRELAVGPGALDSLLVGTGLASLAFVTETTWVAWAAILAVMTGTIQLTLAALRAGFLVNFLSRPVINGFTSAAALVIALGQVRTLLGLPIPSEHAVGRMLASTVGALPELHVPTAVVGVGSVVALVGLRRWRRRFPGPLVLVVGLAAVSWAFDLAAQGVSVIGTLPVGVPKFERVDVGWAEIQALLPTALTVAFVGYLTMISIGQTFANRRGVALNANRELAAAGVANVLAGVSRAFPVSASFSRSSVHADAGPATPRALIVTAGWILLVLIALGPLLGPLPRAVLSAIILVAVLGLVDTATPRRLWRVKRADALLLGLTFVATLGIGIERGVLVGVAASLALLIVRTTRPHAAVLGRVGDSTDFRNVANYPNATVVPGVLVLRIDAQFYFGNVTFLRELLHRLEREASSPLHAVVLDASSMNQLDSSANDALAEIAADYERRGIRFVFAQVKMPVLRVMQASGLAERLGADAFFPNVDGAVRGVGERGEG